VDAAGNRTSETQTDAQGHTNTYQWVYDAVGRLVRGSLDAYNSSLDTTTDHSFDLVGNRLKKSVDTDGDQEADEVTDYVYNHKDRLLSEELSVGGTVTQTGGGPTSSVPIVFGLAFQGASG
jgi:hypothetical protein